MPTFAPPDPIAKIPILMKTVEEWQALPSFGGSSGSAKVQLVNVIGDPSKPGLYIQLEKVASHVVIQAHHHAGDRTDGGFSGRSVFRRTTNTSLNLHDPATGVGDGDGVNLLARVAVGHGHGRDCGPACAHADTKREKDCAPPGESSCHHRCPWPSR